MLPGAVRAPRHSRWRSSVCQRSVSVAAVALLLVVACSNFTGFTQRVDGNLPASIADAAATTRGVATGAPDALDLTATVQSTGFPRRTAAASCDGFYVGTSSGSSNVIHDGISLDFDPKKEVANYAVQSTTFWFASVRENVPMTFDVDMQTTLGSQHCAPTLSTVPPVVTSSWQSVTVTYNCTGVGQFKLGGTVTLAGNCSSLGAVSFYWYKTRGSALQLGTTSGGSDIIDKGVTAPTWASSTGHFFNADTNDLHFYARIAPGVLGPSLQGQPYTLTGVDSKPQDVASPTVTKFPATLTTATVDGEVAFSCKSSGSVDITVTFHFFPFAPSSFSFSFHCKYVASLQAHLSTLDDAVVVNNGVTNPQWSVDTASPVIRPYTVKNDTFVFQNTGSGTAHFKPMSINAVAMYGGAFCTAELAGSFANGGAFPPNSRSVVTVSYHCPGNTTGAWTQFTITITPLYAWRSVISWQQVAGSRTGFDISCPVLTSSGATETVHVVNDGLVNPGWTFRGLTTPAAFTMGAGSWGVPFTFKQTGYPGFHLSRIPTVSANGIMNGVDPKGIIPIAEGSIMQTAYIDSTSEHLNVMFWSKDAVQEAVVSVQLEMPFFKPVNFAFNKMLRWQTDVNLVSGGGNLIVNGGDTAAEWGPSGLDVMARYYMPTLTEEFSIAFSGTGTVYLGAPRMAMNDTSACTSTLSGDLVTNNGGSLTLGNAATTLTLDFNCSNVDAVTLYTLIVPFNSTDPEYSPLLWQFLKVSSPSYPTQPQDVHASSGDKTATVSCTSNDHGIPVDLAQLRAFWPCNNPTNVTLYNRAVAGQTSPYSFEISGLNNGRPYMFDIRIHNAAGWSEVSGMSNCVTPAYDYSTIIVLASCGGGLVLLITACLCYRYCCRGCACDSENGCCARLCPCCKCRIRCPCCPRSRRSRYEQAQQRTRVDKKAKKKKDKKRKKKHKRRRRDKQDGEGLSLEDGNSAAQRLLAGYDPMPGDTAQPHSVGLVAGAEAGNTPLTQELSSSALTRDTHPASPRSGPSLRASPEAYQPPAVQP